MRRFMQDMNVIPVRQANKGLIIVDQHYGLSDLSALQSMQGGPSSFPTQGNNSFFEDAKATTSYGHNMATPNWQIRTPSHHGEDDVIIMVEHETGNYSLYENVDPSKVRREDYINRMKFLLNPYDVYLYCNMMGYMVSYYFWRQLVSHLCMPGSHSLKWANQEGWLSKDHMNAWIELLIRERTQNANWAVSKSGIVCVHSKNKRFMIQTDQHIIETLDGSTCVYAHKC
nr:hypothetical protein [Tanacetum cinerariifolium]